MSDEILNENIEVTPRVNPFCVISKSKLGEYSVRDIQTNGSWNENPYEDYAVVPDDMVTDILATKGFCDIELNEDGTEVLSFVALDIPQISAAQSEPSKLDLIEAQVTYTALMTDTLL